MKIGVLKEHNKGEQRVALVPANVARLSKHNEILVQSGAGTLAGFTDEAFEKAGAKIVDFDQAIAAELVLCVSLKGEMFNAVSGKLSANQTVIATMDPLIELEHIKTLQQQQVTAFALELVPRITRAQSMDVLSSMATIAGYQAVLIAAERSPRLFPMMMTAAGTLKPSRIFVMGAGVAGLQACATAKRLGGVVEAYDIREAAREQILSVGARPVQLDLKTEDSETKGGYASEQSDDFIARQQAAMANVLAEQDVVITTAAIPGRPAPKLITKEMVANMKPGSVIVDLAAESGGNCELTKLDEEVHIGGVTILGPSNMPSKASTHASEMFATNIENLLKLIAKEGKLELDFEDEVVSETCATHSGNVVSSRLQTLVNPQTQENT